MSDAPALTGAKVDAVAFGLAYFQLRLSTPDAEFSVTSSADVSAEAKESVAVDFRDSKAGSGLVELIGAEMQGFVTDEAPRSAEIRFGDGKTVRAWWPDQIFDNLFVVRRTGSDDWWVVG